MDTDKQAENGPAAPPETEARAPITPLEALYGLVGVLETSVKLKETKMGRVMRICASTRSQLSPETLRTFISTVLAEDAESKAFLMSHAEQASVGQVAAMDTTEASSSGRAESPKPTNTPEVEILCFMLLLMNLLDNKKAQQAKEVSIKALQRLSTLNRRTLDTIAARIYFYYAWSHEQTGQLADVRSTLLALHRTTTLRHDSIGQETLLNLLLRNYLHYGLYDQAEKFRSKAQKEDVFRSHQQYCRYLYYLGRIRAIQLEYSEARDCLQQASRKAPTSALGFRVTADKWLILVRLLLGEVPERAEFAVPGLSQPLQPYYEVTQAVRRGNLDAFAQVAAKYDAVFRADATRNLVTRLHQNVLRTGLKRISMAYSRISLADVAAKLALPSVEDTECIVAKAIRDGGVDAVLDHDTGAMVSKETQDVYVSSEPAEAFHARVAFCLDLHNEAIKAMRYEPDAHKKKLESATARSERLAAEAELAKALEEENEDEGMDGF